MKTKNLLMALCLVASTSSTYAARNCDWPAVTPLKSGSPVSTFTHHYWEFSKSNLSKEFKSELLAIGPVVGDYHFGNISAYFNTESKKAELAVIDMDDSGEGSFLADYLKLIVYLLEKELSFDDEKMIEAYIAGLKSESLDMKYVPSKIQDLLSKDEAWYALKQKAFLKGEMNKQMDGLKNDKDYSEIETFPKAQQELNRDLMKALRQDVKILDSAIKYNESGSSAGSQRLIMLAQDKKDKKNLTVLEYKELRCGGVEKYESFKGELADRFELMKKALQSQQFWQNAYIINLKNKDYLLREKQYDPFLELKLDKSGKKDAEKYSEFYAYYLGYLHSKNVPARFAELIEDKKKDIKQNGTQFAKEYLELLNRLTRKKK